MTLNKFRDLMGFARLRACIENGKFFLVFNFMYDFKLYEILDVQPFSISFYSVHFICRWQLIRFVHEVAFGEYIGELHMGAHARAFDIILIVYGFTFQWANFVGMRAI